MDPEIKATENNDPLTQNVDPNIMNSAGKSNKSSGLTKSALTGAFKTPATQNTMSTAEDQDEAVMIKYSAYWLYKKDEQEKLYSCIVELPHLETVLEAIRDVLPFLNHRLEADHVSFTLSEDPTLFDLYKAKKSGHPKLDYPALDSTQILNQTGVQQISIVEKDSKAIIPKAAVKEAPKMVDPVMPVEQSTTSLRGVDEEFVVETSCWCIKTKKPVPKNNANISMQNLQPENLNSSLLDDSGR